MTPDERYMQMALELAEFAQGQTSPNPAVGAVLIKDDRLVGIGSHLQAGTAHAEVHALRMAGDKAQDSTLYVTLEPCSHYGKTPPCADAIIGAGVKRVVAALEDPSPNVAGSGIAKLRSAGIMVEVGLFEERARRLNRVFLHHVATGFPFVTLKLASTLDGYTATEAGDSLYITSDASRDEVHRLRSMVDGVIVGVETVRHDDPQLTVRSGGYTKNPARIVFDSSLRIPEDARLIAQKDSRTIVVTTDLAPLDKEILLQSQGIEVIRLASDHGRVPVREALRHLAAKGFRHLLLEGGERLASAFMAARLVTEVWVFHAPKLLGGGKGLLTWRNPVAMSEALALTDVTHQTIADDVLTIGRVVYPSDERG